MLRTRTSALIAAAVAIPLLLSSCGGDPATTEPTASASASPTSSGLVGGDPSTWAPTELTQADNGTTVEWVVGQAAILTDLPATDANNNITVMSSNPTIVEPVQGDGTTTNPGFRAIAPGYARIIVWDGFPADGPADPIEQFTVQVTSDPAADGNPWNEAPLEITGKKVTMRAGQTAMWTEYSFDKGIKVKSKADLIAEPWTADDAQTAGFTAIGVGKTKVKVKNADGKVVAKVKVIVTP